MRKLRLIVPALLLAAALLGCVGAEPVGTDTPPPTEQSTPVPTVSPTPDEPVSPSPPPTVPVFTAPAEARACGVELGGLTREQARAALEQAADGFALTLEVSDRVLTVTAEDAELYLDDALFDAFWQSLEQGGSPDDALFCADTDALDTLLSAALNVSAKEPTVSYSAAQGRFVIAKGSDGVQFDIPAVTAQAQQALSRLAAHCEADAQCSAVSPSRREDDPRLTAAVEQANRCLTTELTYLFSSGTGQVEAETVRAEQIAGFLRISPDLTVSVSRAAVEQYARSLANAHSDAVRQGEFLSSAGEATGLTVDYYGHRVDSAALTEDLYTCLTGGISGTREVPYVSDCPGLPYGGHYVEVDLTRQVLYVYRDGACVVSTPIVSGCVADGNATPTGVFSVYSKAQDVWLKGPTWYDHVDYWMAFYGAYGLHDADWRSEFGDEIYLHEGSHGCPNLPPEIAGAVYENVEIGTHVIIHGGLTQAVDLTQEITGSTCYDVFGTDNSFRLDFALKYPGAAVSFLSDSPDVATVSADGIVTVHGTGTARITIRAEAFTYHTCAELTVLVTVSPQCQPGEHRFGDWAVVSEARCEVSGSEHRVCTLCGTEELRELPAVGHSFSSWETVTPPDCECPGRERAVCSVCGGVVTRELPATGHSFSYDSVTCLNGCGTLNPELNLPGSH